MSSNIRILILEDSANDAELVVRSLKKTNLLFESLRVDTRESFTEALKTFNPDLILSDYQLPGFNGMEALKIAVELAPDTPFITVTGAIGEELTVDMIKQGAVDYVFKDRLARLPSAVTHALEERKLKNERIIAEERFKIIFQNALDGIVLIDEAGHIIDCNPEFESQTGRSFEELKTIHIWEIRPPEIRDIAEKKFFEVLENGKGGSSNLDFQKPDGTIVKIEFRTAAVDIGGKRYLQSIARDITERIKEQQKLSRSENNLLEAQEIALLGSWELDIKSNSLIWSDEIYKIFEIDKEKFGATYEAFLNAIHPDDREMVNLAYTNSLKTREKYDITHRLLMPDGRIKHVHEICKTSYDENNNPFVSTGTVQDISRQFEAEERIRNLNRTLRTISACNESLVRAKSEEELLKEICNHIAEIGNHLLAWIGYPAHPDDRILEPISYGGSEDLLNAHIKISRKPDHSEKCLTVNAWKNRRTVVLNNLVESSDVCADKNMKDLGVNSILALPLINDKTAYGVLTIFSQNPEAFKDDEIALIQELADDIAFGIKSLRVTKERDQFLLRFGAAMKNTIIAIARTLEMRDPYTAGHQIRVANLARTIALEMGLPEDKAQGIHLAGIIHDIGKITIPSEILSKPGKLSDLDFQFIKTHPQAGYDILKDIEFPWPIAQVVLQHHERLDGSGYPNKLKWGEILPEAHILHVADVVEAMSSHRPYRPSLGIESALDEITKFNGIHYDPKVVQACLVLFREKKYSFEELE